MSSLGLALHPVSCPGLHQERGKQSPFLQRRVEKIVVSLISRLAIVCNFKCYSKAPDTDNHSVTLPVLVRGGAAMCPELGHGCSLWPARDVGSAPTAVAGPTWGILPLLGAVAASAGPMNFSEWKYCLLQKTRKLKIFSSNKAITLCHAHQMFDHPTLW